MRAIDNVPRAFALERALKARDEIHNFASSAEWPRLKPPPEGSTGTLAGVRVAALTGVEKTPPPCAGRKAIPSPQDR